MDDNPGECDGESVKNEQGAATAEGEAVVREEMIQPLETQKEALVGAYGAQTESMFDVSSCKESALSLSLSLK